MAIYKVDAWYVKTAKFDGLIYDQSLAVKKWFECGVGTLAYTPQYRDHEPMPHMSYVEIQEAS